MSIALAEAPKSTSVPAKSNSQPQSLTEAYYTICPVFTASNIAVELGWFDEEFARAGAQAIYLRSLKNNHGFLPHFTHSLPNLFRDGGAIPPLQAKADLSDTTLVGLTWGQRGGVIVVKSASRIRRIADLKGRRIGLFRSLNSGKVDFHRATSHRGILLALELADLSAKDAELVDLDEADAFNLPVANKPSEVWPVRRRQNPVLEDKEVLALRDGKIDALYVNAARAEVLVNTGEYTVIEDLSRRPDWTLQVANGPYPITVSTPFAKEHPEVVVAFLRASIRAGRWANSHRSAAAEIFTRVTASENPALIEQLIADIDFVPSLSPLNLAAIGLQQDFLREHGYQKGNVDIAKWADSSYLEKAHRSF
ncbi:ABC-type nitrate/sulfonate/bicarbonate transport system, substrate-binding protein [Verrucomicrobium sp. GAS474]|uniref:ABC transporter substrate-binding protein n=1 Tax=Verrucomicrobium sp. GAS474 TaxID=1882831 RepID=UPI00087BC866|nr:ABC transporter substrate-binding protein [Verrucomicrobium sp. GAS474]SDT85761.1 ABC-type nitrate/sulfonate/bicarbonate transport system, substrate-binding protein [Verrucomicrobium sp. GAS474]